MARLLLTDEVWDLISDLFAPRKHTSRRPLARRQVLNGILWILRTGAPCVIFQRNSASGKPLGVCSTSGIKTARAMPFLNFSAQVTLRSVNRIASYGVLIGPLFDLPAALLAEEKREPQEPAEHASGRSRGGFSTKIHIICDGQGLPLEYHLTGG